MNDDRKLVLAQKKAWLKEKQKRAENAKAWGKFQSQKLISQKAKIKSQALDNKNPGPFLIKEMR